MNHENDTTNSKRRFRKMDEGVKWRRWMFNGLVLSSVVHWATQTLSLVVKTSSFRNLLEEDVVIVTYMRSLKENIYGIEADNSSLKDSNCTIKKSSSRRTTQRFAIILTTPKEFAISTAVLLNVTRTLASKRGDVLDVYIGAGLLPSGHGLLYDAPGADLTGPVDKMANLSEQLKEAGARRVDLIFNEFRRARLGRSATLTNGTHDKVFDLLQSQDSNFPSLLEAWTIWETAECVERKDQFLYDYVIILDNLSIEESRFDLSGVMPLHDADMYILGSEQEPFEGLSHAAFSGILASRMSISLLNGAMTRILDECRVSLASGGWQVAKSKPCTFDLILNTSSLRKRLATETVEHDGFPLVSKVKILPPSRPNINARRDCQSPEVDIPFPFSSCPSNTTHSVTTVPTSRSSGLTCSLCRQNEFTIYLDGLKTKLKAMKQGECQGLLTYSAAFGATRRTTKLTRKHVTRLKGRCMLLFVLEEEMNPLDLIPVVQGSDGFLLRSQSDPTALRVPIPRRVLPYKSLRRNVKLFKILGHLLFPWVERLVWIDAKLQRGVPLTSLKRFFRKTVEIHDVCSVFISAPPHKNIVGRDASNMSASHHKPSFSSHCRTTMEAAKKRPSLTDSVSAISRQCQLYSKAIEGSDPFEIGNFALDDVLIDSAFVAWDLRSERCRKFISDLTCTWADEIHCHSDRDQMSFPYTVHQMHLQEQKGRKVLDTKDHNTIFIDTATREPAIEFVKSRCHWYYWNENGGTLECATADSSIQPNGMKYAPNVTLVSSTGNDNDNIAAGAESRLS